MKLLNANLDAAAPKGSRPAKPDLHAFEFQVMRFLYDANSMGMAVLDDSDKDSAIPEHPLIGVQWKPVFPPNPSQDVRSLVLNVTHGCNLRCDYCLPPGTPILMSDFTHQPIEQLQVGDQVIGFSSSKKGKHSKLCISTVEAKSMRDAPLIRVETEDQEFLCTTDHHWYGDSRYRVAQVGRRISRVCSNITRKKIGLLGRNNHCFTTPLKIIPVGRGPVFSLQTSTGNYVANGLLSKNCQVKNCIDDSDSMPPDVAIRAINFAFPKDDLPWGDGRMQARLSFFGGEPLLAWKTIVEAVRYFEGRSFPNRPKFSMTTNATLLDEARVQFLARHGFSLIVSLDGPEDVHDLHRKTVQGAGSFKDVLAALRLLQRANMGGRITLRSTYTPQTADRVQECTSYLNGLVREGLASHVSVEPSFLSESICKSEGALKFGIDGDAMARLEESYVLTARWFIQEILDGRKPVLHHFTKFLERLLWRLPQPSDCGASRGYITVGPRGDVFACHREAATGIGTIWNGFDESLRAPWYDNRLYCREGCPECSIRYLCGGGCRERSAASGNVRRPTGTECSLKRIWTMCTALIMASCPTETLVKIIRNPRAKKESGTAPGPTGAVCPHS